MIYFPRSDGQLAVLTYEPDAGVLAWQRWKHSDNTTFISCAVVPESGEDTVYVTVKRGSNYYLEKFADPFPDDQDNCQFLDSLYDVTADSLSLMTVNDTLAGATWLANLTVTVFEDGAEAGTESVDASGNVDLSAYTGSQVYVGLPFTCKLETMPIDRMLETTTLDDKRIVRGIFRLYRSLSFKTTAHSTWGTGSAVDEYTFGTTWETDDVEVEFPGDAGRAKTFKVVSEDAYPLSIQAMMLEVDTEGE
jgi:hypothetical protein